MEDILSTIIEAHLYFSKRFERRLKQKTIRNEQVKATELHI